MSSIDIQFIVQKMRSLFNFDVSLVSFSETSGSDLIRLLSDTVGRMSALYARQVKGHSNDARVLADKIAQFLRSVKYQPPSGTAPEDFHAALYRGDADVIYPIFKWVLHPSQTQPSAQTRAQAVEEADAAAFPGLPPARFSASRTDGVAGDGDGEPESVSHPRTSIAERAFVGYYLSEVALPVELLSDPECTALRLQIKELQASFVDSHKALGALRRSGRDPAQAKRVVARLEREQEQLEERISRTETKVEAKVGPARWEALGEVCTALRKQQDEAQALKASLAHQRYQFEVAEGKYNRAITRLQEIRSEGGSAEGGALAGPDGLLAALQEEAAMNRRAVNESLPRDIERKHKHLSVLQYVLQEHRKQEGWTASRLEDLRRSNQQRAEEIRMMEQRRNEHKGSMGAQAGDVQLVQQRQVAKMVAKKRRALEETLEAVTQEKEGLVRRVEAQAVARGEDGMDSDGNGHSAPEATEEQRQAMRAELARETERFAGLKARTTELRAEEHVLERTASLLAAMEPGGGRRGVVGGELSRTAKALGEVSVAKHEVDEMKGAQLEEISALVKEINFAIKDRKAKLAPFIKELKTLRENHRASEQTFAQRDKAHRTSLDNLDARLGKLAAEERSLRHAVNRDESLYHLLNCSGRLLQTRHKRAANAGTAERVLRKYDDKLREQSALLSALRDRSDTIEHTHSASVDQIAAMQGLAHLLALKHEALAQGNVQPLGGPGEQVLQF